MPSASKNVRDFLTINSENHDFLPLRLSISDLDVGSLRFIRSFNVTVQDKSGNSVPVPVLPVHQEKWAEAKNNWAHLTDEGGKEVTMPFMALRRSGVKQSDDPLKRSTIPVKRLFPYTKVPIIENGQERGYDYYDIPQAPRIDITYELTFVSHYLMDTNEIYKTLLADVFNEYQGYFKINGHYVQMTLGEASEEGTTEDIKADNFYKIVFPLTLHGKIVDHTKFKKIKSITKIRVDIK